MKKNPFAGADVRARTLRRSMTEAEKRVWQVLRLHRMRGCKFRRQVPIGRYIADFVCHEARLIVEIDGGQHDALSPREAERNEFVQSEGHRILRFWNNEVLENLDGVQETIARELGRITPTRTLPHHGGGPDHALPPPRWGGPGWGDAHQSEEAGSVKGQLDRNLHQRAAIP